MSRSWQRSGNTTLTGKIELETVSANVDAVTVQWKDARKLVGVSAVFLLALPWIIQLLVKYTTELFRSIPSMVS